MNEELSKRFTEVYEVLKCMSKQEYDKIPSDIIEYIRNNKDNEYIWNIDKTKKLYEQNLNIDTVAILSYINMEYLVNEEQKLYLKELYLYNDRKNCRENNHIKIKELFPPKYNVQVQDQLIEDETKRFLEKTIDKLKKIIKKC